MVWFVSTPEGAFPRSSIAFRHLSLRRMELVSRRDSKENLRANRSRCGTTDRDSCVEPSTSRDAQHLHQSCRLTPTLRERPANQHHQPGPSDWRAKPRSRSDSLRGQTSVFNMEHRWIVERLRWRDAHSYSSDESTLNSGWEIAFTASLWID
jgi:hypothetical protein